MKPTQAHLIDFIDYSRSMRDLSATTLHDYERVVTLWLPMCPEQESKFELFSAAREFVCSLSIKGLSAKTINNATAIMRQFYLYLCMSGIAQYNPFAELPRMRQAKPLPKCPTEDQVMNALKSIKWRESFEKARQFFAVFFLFRSGLRCHELSELKRADVDKGLIHVRNGKGRKERYVPITNDAERGVNWWKSITKSEYLICNEDGSQCGDRDIRRIVEAALQTLIPAHRHPHALRHAYATTLLEHGVSLISIRELLGHSSVRTTEIYTHLSVAALKDDYLKLNRK